MTTAKRRLKTIEAQLRILSNLTSQDMSNAALDRLEDLIRSLEKEKEDIIKTFFGTTERA